MRGLNLQLGKTRVLLCIPPLDASVYGKGIGGLLKIATSLIPQGLCHLAAVSRNLGFPTRILDCQALGLDMKQAIERVREFSPDFVGLSASTLSIVQAGKFAGYLKRILPEVTTVVGGYHISALPEQTLEEFPDIDIGVVGEGEETFSELLETVGKDSSPFDVPGLVFRNAGKIQMTDKRPVIANLDSLPLPAWDLLPKLSKYYGSSAQRYKVFPAASLITSRGCPHQCTFCDRSVFGNRYRGHSADYVMEMIRTLRSQHGIRSVVFNDDLFIADRNRLVSICETMIREGMRLNWSCDGHVNHLDEDILRLMKRAGCWQLAIGIESGEEKILEDLNKGIGLEKIAETLDLVKQAGLKIKGFFVFGTPSETEQSLRKTIDFAKRLPLDEIQITAFTPYPGTELYRYVVRQEGFVPEWGQMNTASPSYVPKNLTKQQLVHYQRKGYKEFYLRPGPLACQLWKMKRPRYATQLVKEAFQFASYLLKTK